jgi:hypothetical protein
MKWDDYGEQININDYVQHQIELPLEIKHIDRGENFNTTNESSNLNSNIESGLIFLIILNVFLFNFIILIINN